MQKMAHTMLQHTLLWGDTNSLYYKNVHKPIGIIEGNY